MTKENKVNKVDSEKKQILKELLDSCPLTKKDKVTDLNKKLEDKLFDAHMNTMYDLFDELLERDADELTEAEDNFVDALINWHRFLNNQEKEKE